MGELDAVLAERDTAWPRRDAFLRRILPRQHAAGVVEQTALIDGSVLANAPFRPAMEALQGRPARREVDRRFVYIDPKPGARSERAKRKETAAPGFFGTIFGALSDIPREQPIRDNLEALEERSSRIRRMQRIIEALRPEVEKAIQLLFGRTLFLDRPTPERIAAWRRRANEVAARQAGFAYAAYGHIKLSGIVEHAAELLFALTGETDPSGRAPLRAAIWREVRARGITDPDAIGGTAAIDFFRAFDLAFRIRRLRFVLRQLGGLEAQGDLPPAAAQGARDALYRCLGRYLDRQVEDHFGQTVRAAARAAIDAPGEALDALAAALSLRAIDDTTDEELAFGLAPLPRRTRRALLLSYLGFAFYDIATLALLQGGDHDEFNPVKVDRISPDDATALRAGGAQAVLKGTRFNSFGAFFSRAYRENDYLWGRLHGADRLIDIVASAMPKGTALPPGTLTLLKQRAFRAILAEERGRLTMISALIDQLEGELG